MNILLVNPPYISLTSARGVGHQIPLGLLCIGGPLVDAAHRVSLLDAERRHLAGAALADAIAAAAPDIVMTGHAGSTPAHPACLAVLQAARARCPAAVRVYGGPYPTYHAADILAAHPEVDVIVRGEGEATALALVTAIATGAGPETVRGIDYRAAGVAMSTPAPQPIADLNAWRVGWELIGDWDLYQCFGLGRAAIVQFSPRLPPHLLLLWQYQFCLPPLIARHPAFGAMADVRAGDVPVRYGACWPIRTAACGGTCAGASATAPGSGWRRWPSSSGARPARRSR